MERGSGFKVKLDELTQYLHYLTAASEDVYWLRSAKFHDLLYFGPASETLWGRAPAFFYQNKEAWLETIVIEDRLSIQQLEIPNIIKNRKPFQFSYRIQRPDGTFRWIKDKGFPIYNAQGKCCAFSGISIDITSEKATEQNLRGAKEHDTSANRAKTQLLAYMSHGLRTPLNALLGMAQILHTSQETYSPEKLRECLHIILESGKDIQEMIDDISDFAQLDTGTLQVESKPINLQEIIETILHSSSHQQLEKNKPLVIDYGHAVHRYVSADPNRVRQILIHLIEHAKQVSAEGNIVIRASEEPKTSMIRIEVCDNGPYIAQEDLDHTFAELSPVGDTVDTTPAITEDKGFTFGLPIMKKLVQLMGGSTGAISHHPNPGATYFFTLPMTAQPAANSPIATPEYPQLANVELLLIDDNVARRPVIKERLEAHRIKVVDVDMNLALPTLQERQEKNCPFQIALISEQTFDSAAAHIARTIKNLPMLENLMLVLTLSAQPADYEIDQALVAGYSEVLSSLQPSKFISGLANSWDSWLEKLQVNTKTETPVHHRVLVVEDNVLSQKVVTMMLKEAGCQVDTAETGYAALKLLEKHAYQLVLMDISLPDISGLEVTTEFRRQEGKKRHTMIVAVSANALEGDELGALTAGMDDYCVKPLSQNTLHELLVRCANAVNRTNNDTGSLRHQ